MFSTLLKRITKYNNIEQNDIKNVNLRIKYRNMEKQLEFYHDLLFVEISTC